VDLAERVGGHRMCQWEVGDDNPPQGGTQASSKR
jgi:hypothetical protein